MKRSSLVLSMLLVACGPSPAMDEPPQQPQAPMPPAMSSATSAPTATTSDAGAATEPSPEEKKKAEERAALEKERAATNEANEKEKARWTPEMKTAAKALADKTYPTGRAAIEAAMASKHRRPGRAERDKARHPAETLDFFGFKPTMNVLECGPGEGWYVELLAPALAKKGKLFATNGDPNGPAEERPTFYAQRFKTFLEIAPEVYGKVETVTIDGRNPSLGMQEKLDMVLVMRGLHGVHNTGKLDAWLKTINAALKPNGVLGIEEHRAKPDANPDESSKKGYLPEKWVIEKIEAAGFKLAGKSELNANPKDTKDYPDGVWTLPPTYRLGDKDHDKYAAIGESDRMTLKFTKVAAKK
jgi:predicted methyltransferase